MKKKISPLLFPLLMFGSTSDVFSQWQQIPTLDNRFVTCMVTTEDSTILVGGASGTLLRSTDNGATWTDVWGNGIAVDTILSLGAGSGYIFVGADNTANSLFRSSDDGITWNALSSPESKISTIYGLVYVDTVLYAATFEGVHHSTNDGESWAIDTTGLGFAGLGSNFVGAIQCIGTKLYASKANTATGIYRTGTDTIHWERIAGFSAEFGGVGWNAPLAGIDTSVFAVGNGGVLMYSGSGTTWISRSVGLPEYLSSPMLSAVDSLLFLYTGVNNEIYMSGDLGLHWELLQSPTTDPIKSMAATKTHVIAETGFQAWRRAANSIVLAAKAPDPPVPSEFRLLQNFPNPFNSETVVSYQLPFHGFVRLSVFDMLGREVDVLANGPLEPGHHTARWNADDHPSGVYVLRLRADDQVQTRKIVLVR